MKTVWKILIWILVSLVILILIFFVYHAYHYSKFVSLKNQIRDHNLCALNCPQVPITDSFEWAEEECRWVCDEKFPLVEVIPKYRFYTKIEDFDETKRCNWEIVGNLSDLGYHERKECWRQELIKLRGVIK